MKFAYTAIESTSGKEKKGSIDSTSPEQAAVDLKAMGLFPTALAADTGGGAAVKAKGGKLTKDKKPGTGFGAGAAAAGAGGAVVRKKPTTLGAAVNQKGITVFTRQMATLIKAGMPILRSLEVLARQEKRPAFKWVIESIADTIRSGGNFSEALLQHPKLFDRLYVNMIKAGEAGGVLEIVLDRLAVFMEKSARIKGKIKSAMIYPVIVIFVAVVIVAGLMVFVIPKFESIFEGMLKGAPLPQLTQFVLSVSRFVQYQWFITILIIVGVVVLYKLFARTKFGIRVMDRLALILPGLGPLVLRASIARFTRTLGTLMASGVPILQSLIITRDTSGNVHLADALNIVHDRVKEGDSVAKPLDGTRIFPGMVTAMIEVGEETGALPEMLTRVADTYDEEVDNAVEGLTAIIEPIMIVILAVIVGVIVIAMFLPIVEIIKQLS
ncbi:MAG: type II secretion system F family protein [Cytophagales bacterium]|nr:type II secretion system F family protein [Rhizobacter sp.]